MAKYKDFKSYIAANYEDLLIQEVEKYVKTHHDGGGFHSINVTSLLEQRVENLEIMYMRCEEDVGPRIDMHLDIKADIVTKGLGTDDYEANRKTRWFTVSILAVLKNGLHEMEPYDVVEFRSSSYFRKEGALDQYLVPILYAEDLEEKADELTSFFANQDPGWNWEPPLAQMIRELELEYYEADLPEGEMGRMYFKSSEETVYEYMGGRFPSKKVKKRINPGTIILGNTYFMDNVGSEMDTIAHEIIHWELHQKFFEILSLLNEEEIVLCCKSDPDASPDGLEGVERAVWWAEWQANNLATRILMPRAMVEKVFDRLIEAKSDPCRYYGEIMEDAIKELAADFRVSIPAAKLRLMQIGYKQAEGAYRIIDRRNIPPYYFRDGALGDKETFTLDKKNYEQFYGEIDWFAELIDSGRFIYADGLVCINDPLYIKWDSFMGDVMPMLTDYALNHVDECCLKFKRIYTVKNNQGDFYNLCYMCKDVNASNFSEAKEIEYEDNQSPLRQREQFELLKTEGERVVEILENLPTSFHKSLDAHLKRIKKEEGITAEEISYRSGIGTRSISDYRNKVTNISMENVYALCIAMHLHPLLSDDLVRKANGGYPYTNEGFFASYLIHEHFMESLDLINDKLVKNGYPVWGDPDKIMSK